jgi:hypothetical protein
MKTSWLRDIVFMSCSMRSRSAQEYLWRSVPLGIQRRRMPFVFSFVGRCHGEGGSQKVDRESLDEGFGVGPAGHLAALVPSER